VTSFAGIDGCTGGWICVWKNAIGAPQVFVKPAISEVFAALQADTVIAIDMPIGLPERVGAGGRGAEQAARQMLTKRRSSIFTIASRPAVYAGENIEPRTEAYHRTNEVALQTSDPPRKISIQAFGIFPRIRELDRLLRSDPALAARTFESHPELAFSILNGGAEMQHPKLTNAGLEERKGVLSRRGFASDFLDAPASKGAKTDDFLDASALLLVAERIRNGEAKSYPFPHGRDVIGLPIAIWA
jgi:predicted RNase H-like nuclease